MSELRCPNCGEIFEMDESNYQQLVKQVRDNEFEEELKRRKKEIETVNENKIALEKLKQEQSMENFKLGGDYPVWFGGHLPTGDAAG